MKKKLNISFVGGDLRQVYLANLLSGEGHTCIAYGLPSLELAESITKAESMNEALHKGQYIIGPIPFSRNQIDILGESYDENLQIASFINNLEKSHKVYGGNISTRVKEHCQKEGISFYDFMDMETVSIENAIATAEGSIVEAIKGSPINLHQSRCLLIGYGRCSKIIADKLLGFKALVTVAARNAEQRVLANALGISSIAIEEIDHTLPSYDFIFNTVPSMMLTRDRLSLIKKETTIIDIATKPGGTDFEAAKEFGIYAKLCLGLPGIYAPKTSAQILAKAFYETI